MKSIQGSAALVSPFGFSDAPWRCGKLAASYFLVVKSISLLELPPAEPAFSQVQAPADLRPHAHEAPEAGLTFSVAALSHEHCRAGFAPQEQVAFWAVYPPGGLDVSWVLL